MVSLDTHNTLILAAALVCYFHFALPPQQQPGAVLFAQPGVIMWWVLTAQQRRYGR
jgi:hypothetical protein